MALTTGENTVEIINYYRYYSASEAFKESEVEMPKTKTAQPPLVTTRLAMKDQARLNEICKLEGKTQTEVVRRAILEMLDRQEQGIAAEVKDSLAIRLKRMEDRLAGLIARNNLDIGTIYQVLWLRSDTDKRDKLWATAKTYAAKRASKKLEGEDLEIKELMKDEIGS